MYPCIPFNSPSLRKSNEPILKLWACCETEKTASFPFGKNLDDRAFPKQKAVFSFRRDFPDVFSSATTSLRKNAFFPHDFGPGKTVPVNSFEPFFRCIFWPKNAVSWESRAFSCEFTWKDRGIEHQRLQCIYIRPRNNKFSEEWSPFCCAAPLNMTIGTNEKYHHIRGDVLNWLEHFMIVVAQPTMRKVNFPHFLPLKEGGEGNPFFSSFNTPTQSWPSPIKAEHHRECNGIIFMLLLLCRRLLRSTHFALCFFFFGD